MRKVFSIMLLGLVIFPMAAVAAESDVQKIESVKYFARPNDSRFQYSLPDKKNMKFSRKKSSTEEESSSDEDIVLDSSAAQQGEKKIIKRMSAGTDLKQNTDIDKSTMPMNYDSHPKFYDPNDMSQQQFLPMMTY